MQYPKVKLGDAFETSAGGTPLKSHNEYYDNGTIPWLRSGEVCQKNITSTELFITKDGLSNSSAKLFPINTVLVAMYGATAGQVGILRLEATTNQAVCGILPGNYIPEYLYYQLIYLKDFLVSQAVGGAQPNVSQEKIKNLEIQFPPVPIQQEIVARLEKELAKVDEMAESFKRMAELADEEFKSVLSETFEHVEGKKVKLGDICSKLSTGPFGSVLHKNDYIENGIPLVNPMHIIGDSIVPSRDMTVSDETAKRLEAYKLFRGDIVIGRRGEMGRAAVVTAKEEGWLCGTGSFFLHLKQQIEPEFFLLCFKSPKCIHQMVNTAKGATMQNLNHGLLKSLDLQYHLQYLE